MDTTSRANTGQAGANTRGPQPTGVARRRWPSTQTMHEGHDSWQEASRAA
jgi:hypothetical protein